MMQQYHIGTTVTTKWNILFKKKKKGLACCNSLFLFQGKIRGN